MNVFEALEIAERVSTPEPPGCQWMSWELLGNILVRPIRGFADDDGQVWFDAATVELDQLSDAAGLPERMAIIRGAENSACRRVVRFSVAEARPPGNAIS